MAKMDWEKANKDDKMNRPHKAKPQKRKKKTTGMPRAGAVKVTKADGTVEIIPPYKGGSTKNIGLYKK